MSDQPRKKAWEMTPEEFGKSFSPHRIYGANGTRFFYRAVDDSARPMTHATRDEAVRHAHRHVVSAALAAGVAVPPEVAALYPDIAADEQLPDIAAIAGTAPNEATEAPLRKAQASADLAERAIGVIAGTTSALSVIGDEMARQRELSVTVATGLVKALNQQAEQTNKATAEMRTTTAARSVEMRESLDRLAATMRQQAELLAAARKPAKPKKWTFKIQRDAHGNIAGLDAEPC